MELAIFAVANLLLLLLLVLAIRLIRSGAQQPSVGDAGRAEPRSVVDVPAVAAASAGGSTSPTVTVPVTVTVPAPVILRTPAVEPMSARRVAVERASSLITVVSSLDADGARRADLLFGVIHALRGVGFRPVRPFDASGRLAGPDGRDACVRVGRCGDGRDRIEVSLDSTLAVEALATLELWHRTEWAGTERLQITARIR